MCQPGRPAPHGTRPRGRPRFGRLPALPEREVLGRALAARVGIRRRLHVGGALVGQLAVRRPAAGVEVDVARVVSGRVRMTGVDETRDQRLHLGHARGRTGLIGGGEDAELLVARGELELVPVGERPPLLFVPRLRRPCRRVRQDLVVDVGDVAHQRHRQPAIGQPAAPQVVDESGAQVPDVRRGLHCWTADVDSDLAVDEWNEVPECLRLGVIEPDSHPASLSTHPGRVTTRAARSRWRRHPHPHP